MKREFVPPRVDIYDLIEDALDGGTLLFVLRPNDIKEVDGEEYYVVDSIHVADRRNGQYVYYLKNPILVPPDFNALSEHEKVTYLSFFTDSVPSEVINRMISELERKKSDLEVYLEEYPEGVAVVLIRPEDVDWVSETIDINYQELEEEDWKTPKYRGFYWW